MPPHFSLDELALALKRVEQDHKYRVFVTRPAEWAVVDAQREAWLSRLRAQIESGSYVPGPAPIADVPKGKGAVRSACLLSLTDEVVYTAAVGRLVSAIQSALEWGKPHPDCSYLLRKPDGVNWVSTPYLCYKIWRERSVESLAVPVHFVVVTDITAYYDTILHEILLSDLKAAGAEAELASYLVGKLLSRWVVVNGRGIPQGLSASDLLAKLYLNTIDHGLSGAGVVHLRYVDDMRLFCNSLADARTALLLLQSLLRHRGLALQSAKTQMLRPDKARVVFDGIQPVLAPLAKKFTASIAKAAGLESDYLHPAEAAKLLAALKAPPTDLLTDAYRAYLMAEDADFNKTLFRYLIGQLGRAKDSFALAHSISLLLDHPEETTAILAYVERTELVAESDAAILDRLLAAESVYPYQHYQFLRWRLHQSAAPSDDLLKYARDVSTASRSPAYLRSAGRLFLGKFGTAADLEQMKSTYASADSDAARIEIVCALQRMENGQRNAFYGQLVRDGPMVAAAVQLVKRSGLQIGAPAL